MKLALQSWLINGLKTSEWVFFTAFFHSLAKWASSGHLGGLTPSLRELKHPPAIQLCGIKALANKDTLLRTHCCRQCVRNNVSSFTKAFTICCPQADLKSLKHAGVAVAKDHLRELVQKYTQNMGTHVQLNCCIINPITLYYLN